MKVLLVGNGEMAGAYADVLRHIHEIRVVGVVGRTAKATGIFASTWNIDYSSTSLEEAIEATDPDAAIAAVSLPSIPEVYAELIQRELLLLLEKPFGLDLGQATRLEELSRGRSSQVLIGMNRRYYSSTRSVLSALSGVEGERFIQIVDQQSYKFPTQRGYSESVTRRWVFANSIHLIDLGRFFARGDVTRVESSGWDPSMDRPSMMTGRIEFTSGDVVGYQALWNQPGPWSLAVTSGGSHWEMRPLEIARRRSPNGAWEDLEPGDVDLRFKPGIYLQTAALRDAYLGRDVDIPTARQALDSVRLLRDLYSIDGTSDD